ncbi:MAG: amino acid permease [Acidobacteria bacterium]|nr:amino acid permease [Acidobacteriota bacterium]
MSSGRSTAILVTPLIWSLPVAAAMAELSSALPEEGGYVVWVKRAFGPRWAFQVGWWSLVGSFADMALYPRRTEPPDDLPRLRELDCRRAQGACSPKRLLVLQLRQGRSYDCRPAQRPMARSLRDI